MRYLLDTNVLSEPMRPSPSPAVESWLSSQPLTALALSVVTLGELRQGIARLAAGQRRRALDRWLEVELTERFRGRVLEVTPAVALAWGDLAAEGRRQGRPLPVLDGLLLATAQVHQLTLVTRNVADCAGRGVEVVDPWGVG